MLFGRILSLLPSSLESTTLKLEIPPILTLHRTGQRCSPTRAGAGGAHVVEEFLETLVIGHEDQVFQGLLRILLVGPSVGAVLEAQDPQENGHTQQAEGNHHHHGQVHPGPARPRRPRPL